MAGTGSGRRAGLGSWLAAALFALAVGGAAGAGIAALYARAEAETVGAAPAPTPVETVRLALQPRYEIVERFLGRVEPARAARLAFERAGLVEAVLIEEGERIAAGEAVARLDAAPLEIERRRLAAARAALDADLSLARATLERARTLEERGHRTGQSLDEARFAVAALEARILETEAAIAAVDLDIEKSTLRAPFDGVLAERLLDEGAVVDPGAAVGLLQETGRPQARIGLPADRATAMAPRAAVTLEAGGARFAATLAAVSPDIDPATRTVSALFDLPADAPLANGAVVRLPLSRSAPGPGAWAPLTALQEGEKGLWSVFVAVEEAGGFVARPAAVETLHVAEGRVFIRGSFADGARIVARGLNRLTRGQPVAPTVGSEAGS